MIIHFVGGSRAGQTEDFASEVSPVDGLVSVGAHLEYYLPAVPNRLVSTALGDATVLVLDSDEDAK